MRPGQPPANWKIVFIFFFEIMMEFEGKWSLYRQYNCPRAIEHFFELLLNTKFCFDKTF